MLFGNHTLLLTLGGDAAVKAVKRMSQLVILNEKERRLAP